MKSENNYYQDKFANIDISGTLSIKIEGADGKKTDTMVLNAESIRELRKFLTKISKKK